MSSSKDDDDSSAQPQNHKPLTIQEITNKLTELNKRLSDAKPKANANNQSKSKSIDAPNPLDKAYNELDYLIRAFQKLKAFETDLSKPLKTLEENVDDIVADLGSPDAEDNLIEQNLKVLRSNIMRVKVQIPEQHQASSSSGSILGAHSYLQTTTASKEVGKLPNPYKADGIFLSGSFLKEFQANYNGLNTREKLCLLSFAIFPENAEVKKRLLRFWWKGELLIKPKENEKCSVNEILGKFVEKGFIEPVSKRSRSNTTSYKMHPIIRCLIIRLAEDVNFFHYDPKGYPSIDFFISKKLCLVKSEGRSLWSKVLDPEPPQGKNDLDPEPQQGKNSKEDEPKPNQQGKDAKKPNQKGKDTKEDEPKAKPNQQGKSPKEDEPKPNKQGKNQEGNESKPNQQGKSWKEDGPKSNKQGKNPKEEEKRQIELEKKRLDQLEKDRLELEKKRLELEKKRSKYLEKLQTLFNVSKQFPDLPEELFMKMKNIGVLYLGRWEPTAERHMEVENTDFLKGLKNMSKLRFFSLQGISGISELPKSLAKLNNLRILDLRACHNLEKLPKEVGSLKMLTYLDLSECYLLDCIPKQVRDLSNLKVLKGFVISKNSKCKLHHLTLLSKLEKLSINVNDDDFSITDTETSTNLSKFNSLKKLKISWGAGGEGAKSTNKSNGAKVREAPKSGVAKAVQKLKMPWRGGGSSKSVPENKAGEVVKPEDKNGDVKELASDAIQGGQSKPEEKNGKTKNQASDAVQGGQSKHVKNEGEKLQESGIKLVKLDLQCYPETKPPGWLVPHTLTCLKRLYIRGGKLRDMGQILGNNSDKKWNVDFLRFKYLTGIKSDWKELQMQFPQLEYLEKVKCPQIAFCPCDASGVWVSKQPSISP